MAAEAAFMDKLTALVKETIGFNADRGDSVKVINAPFKVEPITVVDTPIWKQPEIIDMLRAAAVPAGLSLVALLVFFGMIKPGLNAALAPAVPLPGSAIDARLATSVAVHSAALAIIRRARTSCTDNPASPITNTGAPTR